jgi:TPR repeat protein
MDPEARRRACVEFRAKLTRDTGTNLPAADCARLLSCTFTVEGEEITLQSDPGLFYTQLGWAITDLALARVIPDHMKVSWFCYREAAEVHKHPEGMDRLAGCYFVGDGVRQDTAQAVVWYEKAAELGDAGSQSLPWRVPC